MTQVEQKLSEKSTDQEWSKPTVEAFDISKTLGGFPAGAPEDTVFFTGGPLVGPIS